MTCELTSLYLLARKIQLQQQQQQENFKANLYNNSQKQHSTNIEDIDKEVPSWAENIVDYVLGLLGHDEMDNNMSSDFKNENLIDLLPAIWGFLNCLDGDQCYNLFKVNIYNINDIIIIIMNT